MSVVEPAFAVGGVHDWFSWVVIASNAVAGLWALGAHRLRRLRGPALWISTAAAQASVFVQAGLGSWLMAREGRDAPDLHAPLRILGAGGGRHRLQLSASTSATTSGCSMAAPACS